MLEVLVTMVIVGILAAVVYPVVVQQTEARHAVLLANDLRSIGTGVRLFNVNLYPAFPSDIEDLFFQPGNADIQLTFEPYPSRLRARWRGPYVDVMSLSEGGDVYLQEVQSGGFEGRIQGLFCFDATLNMELGSCSDSPEVFVALRVDQIRASEFASVNDILDGESEDDTITGTSAPSWEMGKVRLVFGGGISPEDQVNLMYYLIAPFKS